VRSRTGPGVLLVLCSMSLVQLGAALSPAVFERAGVAGVTWLRLLVAAVVLVAWARPSLRGRSRRDLLGAAALGATSAAMTFSFMFAIDRAPFGVVVTIEFLGPLALAVSGARRWQDGAWILLAGTGVALLTLGPGTDGDLDPLGLLLALSSGVFWAGYILLTRSVGRAWTGLDGLAVALAVSAILTAPAGLALGGTRLADPGVILACAGLAVLLPILPYSLEMAALRRVPAATFGVLMSLEPGLGALLGFIVLGQGLSSVGVTAVVMVILASAGATAAAARRERERERQRAAPLPGMM
jgi:inner membrane transporter RhtA